MTMLSEEVTEGGLPPRTRKLWTKFHDDLKAAEPNKVYRYLLLEGETQRKVAQTLRYAARQLSLKLLTRGEDGYVYWMLAEPATLKTTGSGQLPERPPATKRQPPSRKGRGSSTPKGKR
jgi:hypothetical protein